MPDAAAMNIRRWRGPLPDADTDESFTLPFTSDIEVNEFMIVPDSDMSKVMYLAMVTEIFVTQFAVEYWCVTKKDSRQRQRFQKIHILKSSGLRPHLNPPKM